MHLPTAKHSSKINYTIERHYTNVVMSKRGGYSIYLAYLVAV